MNIPQACDWVKARNECSIERVFQSLRTMVGEHVDEMKVSGRSIYTFSVNDQLPSVFAVTAKYGNLFSKAIQFEHTSTGTLEVREVGRQGPARDPMFVAVPRLSEDGACRLHLEGDPQPLFLWQVSRKALEELFFGV